MTARLNENVTLDVRVEFVNGGDCENQTTRILTVNRILPRNNLLVYSCSNISEFSTTFCNNTPKFMVVREDPFCETLDCKYNIRIVLLNVQKSDAGTYDVSVKFEEGNSMRTISRTFELCKL